MSIVAGTDFDLHRRSRRDIERHKKRVEEAIRKNLPEIISREDIVSSGGQKTVKVPIRNLHLPRFRFDPNSDSGVGQGPGGTEPGTVLGKDGQSGQGKQAGQEPGQDIYETEITIDELVELAFDELGLPFLQPKSKEETVTVTTRYDTIRKVGPQANLDPKRTLLAAFRRNASLGHPGWGIDPVQDPRFKSWEEVKEPVHNAVVFAMRDVSGSMGEDEAYLCRTFYTWLVRFLRQCYSKVLVVFITCHTEAREVDEDTFFHLDGSGGTRLVSAYTLCLDIIQQRFNPSAWNIYPFLFSDGYDWDEKACADAVSKLLEVSNLVGYGEVEDYGYWHAHSSTSSYLAPLGKIYHDRFAKEERFVQARLSSPSDVWPTLKAFLRKRHESLEAAA